MSSLIWTIALCATVFLLFTITLLPALIELYWPKDIAPLKVVREHDGKVANFAEGFNNLIETELGSKLTALGSNEIAEGRLQSGENYLLLGKDKPLELSKEERSKSTVSRLVVGAGAVALPLDILFAAEIYSAGDFSCASLCACRAVFSCGNAVLASETVVLRWIHARGFISVGSRTQLFGRASSDAYIELAEHVKFERLHAPKLFFGTVKQNHGVELPNSALHKLEWQPENNVRLVGHSWRMEGNVTIPADSSCAVPLVVTGSLAVGEGSWFVGAIKSDGSLSLGKGCRVDQAVVAGANIDIGEGCQIKGPVIGEAAVILRQGSVIGSENSPATISAPRILIEPGVIVYGSVWARELGVVKTQT